jgi:glycosyltransferase involved in cell wall biosynthesis
MIIVEEMEVQGKIHPAPEDKGISSRGRDSMKFLFLEPFFGGSHRDFAEGLAAHSRHRIDLVTLPARFWKWRMRGAALHFYRQIDSPNTYDGLITSDLMSLADFKMLVGADCPPALVYFHENQITYPLAPGESMDVHFGFTDITTGLAATRLLFNSSTHMHQFFDQLPGFLKQMPEFRPHWVEGELRRKAGVLYPGCRFSAGTVDEVGERMSPPLIIWNHRWEFDKNPEAFFDALEAVRRRGARFRLALLGENFQMVPKAFIEARERFKRQLVHYGYAASREEYLNWLRQGHVVISTANQENFGIAVVEAMRCGCLPLLPNRLAYPEVLPEPYHADFLYEDQADLIEKLMNLLTDFPRFAGHRAPLMEAMGAHAWERVVHAYDRELSHMVTG